MTDDANLDVARNKLAKLEKAIAIYEFLMENGGEAAVMAVGSRLAETAVDDEHVAWAARTPAMKHSIGRNKPITLMKNKSKVVFNGITKDFKNVIGQGSRDFNKLADGYNVSEATVNAVKAAVLRTSERRAALSEDQRQGVERVKAVVNRRTELNGVLKNHTAAAATLKTLALPTNAELIANALPDDFKPKSLSDEFLEARARIQAGHTDVWTAAAKTLERPKVDKFPDPEDNEQGATADAYWRRDKAAITKQARDKTNPKTRQDQFDTKAGLEGKLKGEPS